MSLGAKIKEVLGAPNSADAAHGEVDHNTPGSFPVDDVAVRDSGDHHNKLHKSNDPRGWSDAERRAHGHRHVDSGVGLTDTGDAPRPDYAGPAVGGGFYESREALSHAVKTYDTNNTHHPTDDPRRAGGVTEERKPADPQSPLRAGEGMARNAAGLSLPKESDDTFGTVNSRRNADQNDRSALTMNTPVGSSLATRHANNLAREGQADLPAAQPNQPNQPNRPEPATTEWATVPFGVGIYNTVTGHGSAEDHEANRGTTVSTVSPSVSTERSPAGGQPQGRQFMLRPENHNALDRAIQSSDTKEPDGVAKREAATGAALTAGTAAAAAYVFLPKDKHKENKDLSSRDARIASQEADPKPAQLTAANNAASRVVRDTSHGDSGTKPEASGSKFVGHGGHINHGEIKQSQQTSQNPGTRRTDEKAKRAAEKAAKDAEHEAQRNRHHEAKKHATAAAAAAAASYAAENPSASSQSANANDNENAKSGEATGDSKDSKPGKGGKLRAFLHLGNKEKENKESEHDDRTTHTLTKRHGYERDLAAASVESSGASKLKSEHHDKTTTHAEKDGDNIVPLHKSEPDSVDREHTGRNVAVVGGGIAATSAVGSHLHHKSHDHPAETSTSPKRAPMTATPQDPLANTGTAQPEIPPASSPHTGPNHSEPREAGRDAAVGAAIVTGGVAGYNSHRREQTHHNQTPPTKPATPVLSGGNGTSANPPVPRRATAATDPNIPTAQSSKDPSRGGMYRVLPSGTPSGMNPDYGKSEESQRHRHRI